MYSSPKYSGEPTAQALATGLATLGRYGDDYMVHASEGETIIPGEIFEANPRLKQDLFRQMTMMGIEDPNRYVVGNSLNSLNPITGQPEFFFKKIWRAAKKVFKKVAPVLAPIVGNLIAPGIGGIIASALTTKLMGGSWGDALKSGALSWAGQGLVGGIGGLGGEGFMSGVGKGLMSPVDAVGGLFSGGVQSPLSQGIFGPRGIDLLPSSWSGGSAGAEALKQSGSMSLFPMYQDADALGAAGVRMSPSGQLAPTARSVGQSLAVPQGGQTAENISSAWDFQPSEAMIPEEYTPMASGLGFESGEWTPAARVAPAVSAPEYDYFNRLEVSPPRLPTASEFATPAYNQSIDSAHVEADKLIAAGDLAEAQRGTYVNARAIEGKNPLVATQVATETATIEPITKPWTAEAVAARQTDTPSAKGTAKELSMMENITGKVLAGGVPAALALVMTEEEKEKAASLPEGSQEREAYTAWQKLDRTSDEARRLYGIWMGPPVHSAKNLAKIAGITEEQAWQQPQFIYGPRNVQSAPNLLNILKKPGLAGEWSAPTALGARGGEVVGPGSGTSDSIPARLSDGEFVMTADAVRNAGNGNRNLGAARMYDMMSRFERMG